jgi:hypothetical protein
MSSLVSTVIPHRLEARQNRQDDFYEDDEDDLYMDEDEESYEEPRAHGNRRRRVNPRPIDDLNTYRGGPDESSSTQDGLDLPSPFGRRSGIRLPDSVSKALLAGVFVLGIGTGVTVDSAINTNPKDLASRDAVDRNAPNPTLCTRYGASAMAFDQRVFVSFDPFNVYVAQADVKPACVLRSSNVVPILQGRGLLDNKEVASCKANMNTWAFVGDLDDVPQLSCVYQSEDAQNEFLEDPKLGIGEDYLDDDRKGVFKKAVKEGATKRSSPAANEENLKKITDEAKGMWSM